MILPGTAGTDGDLVVRAWELADAEALAAAVQESRWHLAPWMEWATAPAEPASAHRDRIRCWSEDRLSGRDGTYGMFLAGRVVGGCGLRRRLAPDGLEIGYWVHADFTGQGICTRAAAMLTQTAFGDELIGRVEIHHDAANAASGAVPAKLGFRLVGESPAPKRAPADSGVERRWRVTRAEWFQAGGADRFLRAALRAHPDAGSG